MERDIMKKLIPLVILILFAPTRGLTKGFRKRTCGYYQRRFLSERQLKKKKKSEFQQFLEKYKEDQKQLEEYRRQDQEATCCGNITAKDIGKGLATVVTISVPVIIAIVQIIIAL